MGCSHLLAPFLWSCAAVAQVSCSASVAQPLVVVGPGGANSIPAGSIPASGVSVQSPIQLTASYAAIAAHPYPGGWPRGALQWNVAVGIRLDINPWGMQSGSATGLIRLSFSNPTPIRGCMRLVPHFSESAARFASLTGDIGADVDNDGVADYYARSDSAVDIPVAFGGPVPLNVGMSISFAGQATSMGAATFNAGVAWEVVILPDTYALEPYGQECAELVVYRSDYRQWAPSITMWMSTGGQAPLVGIFLCGFTSQNQQLPVAPFCDLLVANAQIVLPTGLTGINMYLDLPHFALPAGTDVYIQGLWIDSAGGLISSNGLHAR